MEFLRETYFLYPTWKWISILLVFALGGVLANLIARLTNPLLARWRKSPNIFLNFFAQTEAARPISWILVSYFWIESVHSLELGSLAKYLTTMCKLLLAFWGIRLAYLAVDSLGKVIQALVAKTDNSLDDQLAPFGTKVLKVFVVIFGTLLTLQSIGFEVVSLLAGLGLGGLALALAAQDTAANVFGSIMIILDRPFQVGQYVKIGDCEGSVEEIGFRSTRIRTPYNSLVSLPNSMVAKEKIDNLSERTYRRFSHTLGLTYGTPPQKVSQICEEIRFWCSQSPRIKKDDILVGLCGLAESALEVKAVFMADASSPEEEWELNHEFLLFAVGIAKKLEIDYAFSTRTIIASSPRT